MSSFCFFQPLKTDVRLEAKQSAMNISSHLNIPKNPDSINRSKDDWFEQVGGAENWQGDQI